MIYLHEQQLDDRLVRHWEPDRETDCAGGGCP